jgi:hypothetical protein
MRTRKAPTGALLVTGVLHAHTGLQSLFPLHETVALLSHGSKRRRD